jgi:hypothetical protein
MDELRIEIERWSGVGHGPPEETATRGTLSIHVGGESLTRHEDTWSRSTGDAVLVSMYPLATWLASNWWRLSYEPAHSTTRPSYEWRASHELRAIGHGYLWPRVTLESDGEFVTLRANPTSETSNEPIRYLSRANRSVPLEHFQRQVREFVQVVIARLHALDIRGSTLEELWAATTNDLTDSKVDRTRRREALLGCDPGEADCDSLAAIADLADEAGLDSAEEIACAISPDDIRAGVDRLRQRAASNSVQVARWSRAQHAELAASCQRISQNPNLRPWQRGMDTARLLRSAWAAGNTPIASSSLEQHLGMDPGTLAPRGEADSPPVGLAIDQGDRVRLLLRRSKPAERRFELARLLGDLLAYQSSEPWHPATETRTSRQRFQRAFAAELLCPVAGLSDLLGERRGEEAMSRAADVFMVSEFVVGHQVENHLDPSNALWRSTA